MLERRRFLALLTASGFAACGSDSGEEAPATEAGGSDYWAYFGTYTRDTSKGVYVSRFNPSSGSLEAPQLAAEIESPSFLTVHPNQRFLYAVTETRDGSVTGFSIDAASGLLTPINTVSAHGDLPCDLEVDSSGKMLVVANYSSGNVAAFPVGEDGRLGEASQVVQHEGSGSHQRQKGPHAHSVDFSADNRFVLISDLGIDKVLIYNVDPENASLTPHDPPSAQVEAGSGPRHFAFHPSGDYAYTINELGSTVTAFAWDAEAGRLEPQQTISTLPEGFSGENNTAEIEVHPSGKFLYASNRGHDSIVGFAIDESNGSLRLIGHTPSGGGRPRSFKIGPNGRYLLAANQDGDNVLVFEIDHRRSGELARTSHSVQVDAPVCVRFVAVA